MLVTSVTNAGTNNTLDPSLNATFSWTTDVTQAYYEFKWREVGTIIWTGTGRLASTTKSHTIAAGSFDKNKHIEWNVRVWDASQNVSAWYGMDVLISESETKQLVKIGDSNLKAVSFGKSKLPSKVKFKDPDTNIYELDIVSIDDYSASELRINQNGTIQAAAKKLDDYDATVYSDHSNTGNILYSDHTNTGYAVYGVYSQSGYAVYGVYSQSGYAVYGVYSQSGYAVYGVYSQSGYSKYKVYSQSGYAKYKVYSQSGYAIYSNHTNSYYSQYSYKVYAGGGYYINYGKYYAQYSKSGYSAYSNHTNSYTNSYSDHTNSYTNSYSDHTNSYSNAYSNHTNSYSNAYSNHTNSYSNAYSNHINSYVNTYSNRVDTGTIAYSDHVDSFSRSY